VVVNLYSTWQNYPLKRQIRLFDLTDFYFEGRKDGSMKAHFGCSKENARLISLALLTDEKGFCCKSKFYEGNVSEDSMLCEKETIPEDAGALTIHNRRGNPIEIQHVKRSDAAGGETELCIYECEKRSKTDEAGSD
jgi:hypothetical protein